MERIVVIMAFFVAAFANLETGMPEICLLLMVCGLMAAVMPAEEK